MIQSPTQPSRSPAEPAEPAWPFQSALVIVAHPDDEILWAGGTMLLHPQTRWTIVVLCRRSDPDRAPKFRRVLQMLGAAGRQGDLDDGPEQTPLPPQEVQHAILALAGGGEHDLILTHSVAGEYTRHRRHEEIGQAVLALWDAGQLTSRELWAFAYQDGNGQHEARAIQEADVFEVLPAGVWERKRGLIGEVYGFGHGSFEAKAAGRQEAFWRLRPVTHKGVN